MKRRSKIGFLLLAIGLFGASTIGACFAEEVRAHDATAERSNSPSLPGEDAAGNASNPVSQSTPRANGDDGKTPTGEGAPSGAPAQSNSPASNGVNLNGIDTRNGVLPRRLANGRPKIGNAKVVKIAPRNLLAPRAPTPSQFRNTMRNAIGVPVAHVGDVEGRISTHHDFSIVAHGPSASMGVVGSATDRLGKVEGTIERPIVHAGPVIKPLVLDRGTINGAAVPHRGVGVSAGIGGPAKTIAGINGTTIRPTH